MAFPSSPTNGQTIVLNNITYAYSSANSAWIKVPYTTSGGIYTSDTPPSAPFNGNLWWNTSEGTLKIYYIDPNGSQWVDAVASIPGPTGPQGPQGITPAVYDLDDISYKADGFTNVFPLTYNTANVSVSSPFTIMVTVNGSVQPAFDYKYDTVWQSSVLTASKGYCIDNTGNPTSNGYLKFADCPPQGSQILIRTGVGSAPTTVKTYPFKPVDVFMGY